EAEQRAPRETAGVWRDMAEDSRDRSDTNRIPYRRTTNCWFASCTVNGQGTVRFLHVGACCAPIGSVDSRLCGAFGSVGGTDVPLGKYLERNVPKSCLSVTFLMRRPIDSTLGCIDC
nr:hypothetical protein [Tanacetum cinerariifolium]